MLHMLYSFI